MESLAPVAYLTLAIAVIGGYLLGSIPFGLIATRLGGAGDIRKIGSGNIGATNVLRSGRKDLAAITLIGDGGKGAVAVGLAHLLSHGNPLVVALAGGAAFAGHIFPVWLKFNGGQQAHGPGGGQQHAVEGGHALAAVELQPDREDVAGGAALPPSPSRVMAARSLSLIHI